MRSIESCVGRQDRRHGKPLAIHMQRHGRVGQRLAVPAGVRPSIRPDEDVSVVDDRPDDGPVDGAFGTVRLDLDLFGPVDQVELSRAVCHA